MVIVRLFEGYLKVINFYLCFYWGDKGSNWFVVLMW